MTNPMTSPMPDPLEAQIDQWRGFLRRRQAIRALTGRTNRPVTECTTQVVVGPVR